MFVDRFDRALLFFFRLRLVRQSVVALFDLGDDPTEREPGGHGADNAIGDEIKQEVQIAREKSEDI